MDGVWWKTLLKWMIWGYYYFWKHPYTCNKFHLVRWWSDHFKGVILWCWRSWFWTHLKTICPNWESSQGRGERWRIWTFETTTEHERNIRNNESIEHWRERMFDVKYLALLHRMPLLLTWAMKGNMKEMHIATRCLKIILLNRKQCSV